MSDADIDDDFDDDFVDDDDAKMVEEAETSVRTRLSSLEKRRLIDNLLEEKRLEINFNYTIVFKFYFRNLIFYA